MGYLVAAYGFAWLLVFAYMGWLGRQHRRLEAQVAHLEALLAEDHPAEHS